jgi:putative transposase
MIPSRSYREQTIRSHRSQFTTQIAASRSAHVERAFAWMTRWRRLVRDYEQRLDLSEAMIRVALGALLLRRVAH